MVARLRIRVFSSSSGTSRETTPATRSLRRPSIASSVDGLGHGAREAVEQHAPFGVRLVEARVDHPDDQVVGHESAGVHDRLGLATEGRVARNLVAEHVAGRDVRHAELHRDARRLGALAAAGRSEHQRDHLMNPLYWRISNWVSICFMVSSATPTTIRMAVPPR